MYQTYRRIEELSHVPPAGPLNTTVRESHRLDFKKTVAPEVPLEQAKDIAVFANTFGGTILVGAEEANGVLAHPGISRSFAARLVNAYEQAASQFCCPVPIVVPIIVDMPTSANVLLAVNVDPLIDGPVGVRQGEAWLFPMRDGSHTTFLRPSDLHMYVTPKLRRTLLLLDCITTDTVRLWVHREPHVVMGGQAQGSVPLERLNAIKRAVDPTKNSAQFLVSPPTATQQTPSIPIRVPLTEIDDIWQDHHGDWNIRIGGRIETRSEVAAKFATAAAVSNQHPAVYIPVVR